MGDAPLKWQSRLGGAIELPSYGFLVESPGFVAFRARNWSGRAYSAAPLGSLRRKGETAPQACNGAP